MFSWWRNINSLAFEAFNKFNAKDYYRMSFFKILEIDLDIEPKEMTILDIDNDSIGYNLSYIVDLEDKDIALIQSENIKEENSIVAIIYAGLDEFGNTTQWFFHQIHIRTKKISNE